MIKHATASTFFFSAAPQWRLGLIHHPRLRQWMLPGGHVEDDETTVEAALRELAEETGLTGRLIHPPAAAALPPAFPYPAVAPPWWILEMQVPADNHLGEPHVHVDHLYVAVAESADLQPHAAAHDFAWFTEEEVASIDVIEDSRILAKELFTRLADLQAAAAAM